MAIKCGLFVSGEDQIYSFEETKIKAAGKFVTIIFYYDNQYQQALEKHLLQGVRCEKTYTSNSKWN